MCDPAPGFLRLPGKERASSVTAGVQSGQHSFPAWTLHAVGAGGTCRVGTWGLQAGTGSGAGAGVVVGLRMVTRRGSDTCLWMPCTNMCDHLPPVIVPWFTGTGEGTEVEGGWGSGRTLSPFPVFSPLLGLPVRVEAGG